MKISVIQLTAPKRFKIPVMIPSCLYENSYGTSNIILGYALEVLEDGSICRYLNCPVDEQTVTVKFGYVSPTADNHLHNNRIIKLNILMTN